MVGQKKATVQYMECWPLKSLSNAGLCPVVGQKEDIVNGVLAHQESGNDDPYPVVAQKEATVLWIAGPSRILRIRY